jgi:flagellar protein FliS
MIDQDAFLRQEVESASPAKLRLLLLQKAHGLTFVIRDLWQKGRAFEAKQWVILIQDIFTELLSGVVDSKHQLAKQQSDLYVFLSKLIILADQNQDVHSLDSLAEILEIEKDTWEMFVRREMGATSNPQSGSVETEYTPFSIEA